MRIFCKLNFLILIIFVGFSQLLFAEDNREVPLDMYLIIDGSASFQDVRNEAVAWLNGHLVDRILMEGDRVTIWLAGETVREIFSGEIPSGGTSAADTKEEIKSRILAITGSGRTADFSGALSELEPRLPRTPENRLAYTVLLTSSAGGLERVLTGSSLRMLRWSRSEKYERWQALVIAPNIGQRVSQAATAYMNFARR